MDNFLEPSKYIDWKNPDIVRIAKSLSIKDKSTEAVIKACFEFVRDEVMHTSDFRVNKVTCRASEVLKHSTGYCYAKSHLLAALLRANEIPTGLTYQRMMLDQDEGSFCLHGLNVVYLDNYGWLRLDPRGNKNGIATEFRPPIESLAFDTKESGEFCFSGKYEKPLQIVVDVLESCSSYHEVDHSLPDLFQEQGALQVTS